MTSTSSEYIMNLLLPKINSAPKLYSRHGVHDVRTSSKLWVRKSAWVARRHPKLALKYGIYLQYPEPLPIYQSINSLVSHIFISVDRLKKLRLA